MSRHYLCLLLIVSFSVIGKCAKCDTIDYYWAYYNDTVWVKLNQYSDGKTLHLNKTRVKKEDMLSVSYRTDTPCFDCGDYLEVFDDKGAKVFTVRNSSARDKLSVPMSKLLAALNKGATYFKFYYNGQGRENVLLFRLDIN